MNDHVVLTVLCLFLPLYNGMLLDDQSSAALTRIMNLEAEVAALTSKLNFLTESINSECNIQCPKRESVAFMAQLSATLVNPATGHVVLFDDVITNVGNAYNAVHGIFTAPVNGTYNFNLIASVPDTQDSHAIHLFIKKNTVKVGYIFLDNNRTYWLRRTTDVTLHLARNDEIWVEVEGVAGPHSLGGCCFHTHLSGFLVEAD